MAIRAIATDSQDFNNPSTTGKPGRDERLDFKNEAGDIVFAIVSDADGTASIQGDAVPKVYRALLSQTDSDAPVATVLENTMGGTVVWTYSDVGTYAGTLAGAFTVDKTFCDGDTSWFNSSDLTGAYVAYFAPSGTGNSVLLSTGIAATLSDGLLANYAVEIIVYP